MRAKALELDPKLVEAHELLAKSGAGGWRDDGGAG